MKRIILLLIATLSLNGFTQEKISDIQINPSIYKGMKASVSATADIDSTFIYVYESLPLSFVHDDFSSNKYQQFNTDYAESGVTSELFYHLMDPTNTTQQDPALIFCDSAYASHITIDVDDLGEEIERDTTYPFISENIWVNDLDFYPVVGEVKSVFQECFVLIDSTFDGVLDVDQDTVWYNGFAGPAYVQDSARVFTKTVVETDINILWVDNYACRNNTFAVDPWSLGVATFDGVDENGMPYEFGNLSAHGIADYLTSRPIDLDVPDGDIAYITFIYQAEGYGNMPEQEDTLLLEFYNPTDDSWQTTTMWIGLADSVEPDEWDTVNFAIPIPLYQDGFRFRFKNYASLSGALDHWHIDYVRLEIRPEIEIATFRDLAIMSPVNTLLQDYTAVPWDHYKATSGNEEIRSNFDLRIYNSDPLSATSFNTGNWQVKNGASIEGDFPILATGGPDVDYLSEINNCTIGVGSFFYDQSIGGDKAEFDVKINIATSASTGSKNNIAANDTTRFTQSFKNFYAYDDGSAEAAYGIEGESALMAYKFEAYQAGKLTGILMQFVPTVNDYSDEIFLLTVWADNDGEPGEIIYQDDFFESHSPEYSGSKEGFRYYEFYNAEYIDSENGFIDVPEIFYVGWQNVGSIALNIGLDWNIDNGDKVFRNTSGTWLTSSFEMSLLIRPVFSTALDYTLSNGGEITTVETTPINLYPNPANNNFTITGLPDDFELNLFDLSGRLIISAKNETNIDISNLDNGVYLVNVTNSFGERIYTTKLIKK